MAETTLRPWPMLAALALLFLLAVSPALGQSPSACPPVFLNDGVCDEPFPCPRGTDTRDCLDPAINPNLPGQPGTASCPSAGDGICDQPMVGTGKCPTGTDLVDCRITFCAYANDGTCDEPGIGTGLCPADSDPVDCSRQTSDNCLLSNNGICNEPPNGSGCPSGTDSTDCMGAGKTAKGTCVGPDCCSYAFDGQCDEPGIGTGRCAAGTDQSDCGTASLSPPPQPQAPARVQAECQSLCAPFTGSILRDCLNTCLSSPPPQPNIQAECQYICTPLTGSDLQDCLNNCLICRPTNPLLHDFEACVFCQYICASMGLQPTPQCQDSEKQWPFTGLCH
jgi:hypothetical protein